MSTYLIVCRVGHGLGEPVTLSVYCDIEITSLFITNYKLIYINYNASHAYMFAQASFQLCCIEMNEWHACRICCLMIFS